MPNFLLHKRLVCDAGTFAAGDTVELDQEAGDRLVASGWAETADAAAPADESSDTSDADTSGADASSSPARKTTPKTTSKTTAKTSGSESEGS
jgi:hypothetical protein